MEAYKKACRGKKEGDQAAVYSDGEAVWVEQDPSSSSSSDSSSDSSSESESSSSSDSDLEELLRAVRQKHKRKKQKQGKGAREKEIQDNKDAAAGRADVRVVEPDGSAGKQGVETQAEAKQGEASQGAAKQGTSTQGDRKQEGATQGGAEESRDDDIPDDGGNEKKLMFTFGNPRSERRALELARTFLDESPLLFQHGHKAACMQRVADNCNLSGLFQINKVSSALFLTAQALTRTCAQVPKMSVVTATKKLADFFALHEGRVSAGDVPTETGQGDAHPATKYVVEFHAIMNTLTEHRAEAAASKGKPAAGTGAQELDEALSRAQKRGEDKKRKKEDKKSKKHKRRNKDKAQREPGNKPRGGAGVMQGLVSSAQSLVAGLNPQVEEGSYAAKMQERRMTIEEDRANAQVKAEELRHQQAMLALEVQNKQVEAQARAAEAALEEARIRRIHLELSLKAQSGRATARVWPPLRRSN